MWQAVSAQEIADLLREEAALIERGAEAGREAHRKFRLRRLSILERIANDSGPFADPEEAGRLRQMARTEAIAMRLGGRSLPGGL